MATCFTGGGLGGSKSSGGGGRVFPAPVEIFSKFSWLSFGHKNILRGVTRVILDFTLLSPHPNHVHWLLPDWNSDRAWSWWCWWFWWQSIILPSTDRHPDWDSDRACTMYIVQLYMLMLIILKTINYIPFHRPPSWLRLWLSLVLMSHGAPATSSPPR